MVRAILAKDLRSKWISEVVPGHYARGRLGSELSDNDNYDGLSNDDEMFCWMLANQKPREIAAAMNLERSRVYRKLRNYFWKFDEHPRYVIDVYLDIFNRYAIDQKQWGKILGGNQQYNYLRLRHHYSTKTKMKAKNPLTRLKDDPEIPEPLKAQFQIL